MVQETDEAGAVTVQAVNELTARWARFAVPGDGGPGTVFTAAGLWPLLAGLAEGGDAAVRGELAGVLGVDPLRAAGLAERLLRVLDGTDGVDAALGLWARPEVRPEKEWVAALPYGTHGELTGDEARDRELLDTWASEHTGGRIPSMPVQLEPDTLLVLASALAVRTRWLRPFTPGGQLDTPDGGPWAGRTVGELVRGGGDVAEADVADTEAGAVTRLTVEGDTGVDVQLLLGAPGMEPGAVLAAGATMPRQAPWVVPGGQLPYGEPGPGVTVGDTVSATGKPVLVARLPAFTVSATHDLLARPAEFGLATASRREDAAGHFPGVSKAVPLAVGSAQQSATATFTAEGFYAAAVTAIGMVRAAAAPMHTAKLVSVTFDRPFGFVAVHRETGLALAAGWVTEPDPAP